MGCTVGSRAHFKYREDGSENSHGIPNLLSGRRSVNYAAPAKPGGRISVMSNVNIGQVQQQDVVFSVEEQELREIDLLQYVKKKIGTGKCGLWCSKYDLQKESFKNKLARKEGDLDKAVGAVCKKGLKPKSPNQDSFAVVFGGVEFAMYIVCDGHGTDGHRISDHAINMLPKFFMAHQSFKIDSEDLNTALTEAFQKLHHYITKVAAQEGFDSDFSGCTATLLFHNKKSNLLTVSHVGDSGSCLLTDTGAKKLIEDHRPEAQTEREHIEAGGGRVEWDGYANHRVYAANSDSPGMNMSRAIGDDYGHRKAGIICEPTISKVQLNPSDRAIFICSDGVWEFLNADDVVSIYQTNASRTQAAIEKVSQQAWECWIKEENGQVVDDITAIVVKLR